MEPYKTQLMQTLFNVKWSNMVKIFTIIFLLIVIGCEVAMFELLEKQKFLYLVITSVILIPIAVYYGLQSPQQIEIKGNTLILRKLLTSLKIEIRDIDIIEPYVKSLEIRLFGSGGYCGYIGTFTNKNIGKYQSYVGKYDQAFYIKTKSGKKYMMSCENRDTLISIISEIKAH